MLMHVAMCHQFYTCTDYVRIRFMQEQKSGRPAMPSNVLYPPCESVWARRDGCDKRNWTQLGYFDHAVYLLKRVDCAFKCLEQYILQGSMLL